MPANCHSCTSALLLLLKATHHSPPTQAGILAVHKFLVGLAHAGAKATKR
jgi:hypothetical protein